MVGKVEKPIVIGIVGATKCGKSWTANVLAEWLKVPSHCIIRTDDYKNTPVPITLENEETVMSFEEPECISFD